MNYINQYPSKILKYEDRFKNSEKLSELFSSKAYPDYENVLEGIKLDNFQTFTVRFAILQKKCIISLGTGLGKTLVTFAVMELLKAKTIWITKLKLIEQLKKDCPKNLKVVCFGKSDIGKMCKLDINYDLAIISYESLLDFDFYNFLFFNLKKFDMVVIDEAHKLGNRYSKRSQIIKHMLKRVPYSLALTATPFTTNIIQAMDLLFCLDDYYDKLRYYFVKRDIITNAFISSKNLDQIDYILLGRYISFTRKELGIKGVMTPYLDIIEGEVSDLTHIEIRGGDKQLQSLLDFCEDHRGEKGIIYCNSNKNKYKLKKILKDFSIGFIDGTISKSREESESVRVGFNLGEYEIVITNNCEGSNLQCNYIYCYEMTPLWQQLVGRGERGLLPNDLTVAWSVTTNTREVEYFYKNVFVRSILAEEAFKKDVDVIKSWEKMFRDYLNT